MGDSMIKVICLLALLSSSVFAGDVGAPNTIMRMGASGYRPGYGSIDISQSAAVGVTVLNVANGGTGLSSPGSSGSVPVSNGSIYVSTPLAAKVSPTVQKFLTTGTTTGYFFTVSSANATVGAVYANNAINFTVLSTIAAGTQLWTSNVSGSPLSSGTLTKQSGTGDSTITFSAEAPLATYTTPTSPAPLYIRVTMVGGGGGGGGGNNTSSSTTGSPGTPSVFGASFLIANGGAGAVVDGGGVGGTASLGSAIGVALAGGSAQGGVQGGSSGSGVGGIGASSPFGGAGASFISNAGIAAIANTGSGGGGGSSNSSSSSIGGGGGGSGGFVDAVISTPASTYVYAVGAGGAGGSSTQNGGNGGSGLVLVTEYYQ